MPRPPRSATETSRRAFLQGTLAAGATLGLGLGLRAHPAPRPRQMLPEEQRLELLILGGTGFLGPHVVEAATARGHTMTLFNRGRLNPGLLPDLEHLRGDRDPRKDAGLEALKGRSWDGAVDTSGYFPRMVRASAELLAPNIGQYVFISSISVYADTSEPNMDETAKLATMPDPTLEDFGAEFRHYGALKALCEQAAEAAMPSRTTSIRPGLIVGPRDNVPRFTYWPVRVERGGEVLAPGNPDDPIQYIDARDLADFIVRVLEKRTMGLFNGTGPTTPTTMAELLYGCKAVTGSDARFTWVDADFLAEHDVHGWSDLPVWLPPQGEYKGFHRISIKKPIDAGLRSRPLAETVRDTLDWFHAWPAGKDFPWRGGMTPQREREVLEAWHAQE